MQTFNYVTIAGALFLIGDFLWALLSEKRRKKVCLLDKAILLPVAAFLIVFDIICFATDINAEQYYFRMYSMVAIFFYVAIAYLFQGIYHYFKPIPAITEAIEEAIEEASKPQIKEPVVNESAPEEEKKEEEKSTEE